MAEQATENTVAEVGHGGAEQPHFPPFNAANFPSQLFWFAIVFIVLYLLMSRVALPRVNGIFEYRRKRIGRDLDDAAGMQRQAEEAGAAYEKTLADARARAQVLAQETRDKLTAQTDARRKELEASLNAKLAAADAQIAETRTKAMANVQGIASEAAAAIVQQLTGRPPDGERVAKAAAGLETV